MTPPTPDARTATPAGDPAVTLLVVDDHPVVRAGMRALLDADPRLHVVGEAANGEEALRLAAALTPDVVLCDLRLGDGIDGVGVARALRRGDPGGGVGEDAPAVLILTTYDHDADIVRAVEAGAAGYLLKDADPAQLLAAILGAARGEVDYSEELQARVVATMRTRRAALSAREKDVLAAAARGLSNREIAAALFVSEATVKTHLNHAFGKLGVESRTAAVAAARAAGLLD